MGGRPAILRKSNVVGVNIWIFALFTKTEMSQLVSGDSPRNARAISFSIS